MLRLEVFCAAARFVLMAVYLITSGNFISARDDDKIAAKGRSTSTRKVEERWTAARFARRSLSVSSRWPADALPVPRHATQNALSITTAWSGASNCRRRQRMRTDGATRLVRTAQCSLMTVAPSRICCRRWIFHAWLACLSVGSLIAWQSRHSARRSRGQRRREMAVDTVSLAGAAPTWRHTHRSAYNWRIKP